MQADAYRSVVGPRQEKETLFNKWTSSVGTKHTVLTKLLCEHAEVALLMRWDLCKQTSTYCWFHHGQMANELLWMLVSASQTTRVMGKAYGLRLPANWRRTCLGAL